jgi:hypothetical protein
MPEPQFPANPIAENCPFSIAAQSLRDISRMTNFKELRVVKRAHITTCALFA